MGRGRSGAEAAPAIDDAGGPADDDHKLVERVRRGDDRAFELLYERYHRRIHAYVLGMVKDHGRAEDVTQEVFLSALRRMRATEQPLALKPWLYQIAKNSCIDAFRRSRRAEEVSYDAEGGLAPADHSKLVASGASPDAAVAAKLELDSLCGAFGGLSETHHEILVLRELEGLSYQQIGQRMGMSRPAVESTLFRARRRLTEEYDDILSGARCRRVQAIIVTAVETRLGLRDSRRLARHLSHCQPCRREALAAGLDRELITRPTVRERLAGLLPFPIFTKLRQGSEGGAPPPSGRTTSLLQHMPMLSDHLHSGWGKAAAGAAVIVAGVGAGAGVKQATTTASPPAAITRSAPQDAQTASAAAKSSAPAATATAIARGERSVGASAPPSATAKTKTKSTGTGTGVESPASQREGASAAAPAAKRDRTAPATGSDPGTPVAAADPRPASSPRAQSPKPTGKKPVQRVKAETRKRVPPAAGEAGKAVEQAATTVPQTASTVTEGVKETTQRATETVDDAVQGVTGGGPVAETVDKATDTADQAVDGAGKTVDRAAEGVGEAVGALKAPLGPGSGG